MLNSNEEGAGFGDVPVKAIEAETEFFLARILDMSEQLQLVNGGCLVHRSGFANPDRAGRERVK